MNSLQLRLAAESGSVPVARHAVSEFAERSGADAGAVAVAVTEAVTNCVIHGFEDSGPGNVLIEARLDGDALMVVISDDGRGMTPNPDSPGLGYGLPLVAALSDEMGIEASDTGGTSVRMLFSIAG